MVDCPFHTKRWPLNPQLLPTPAHVRGISTRAGPHCVKLLGQRLMARNFDRQVAEFQVRVAVLNGFTALGIAVTEVVG
jgi:hypothetical protein